MKTSKFLVFILSIMFAFPSMAVAYGEGTTQGAVKSGIDSGKICRCETLEQVRQGERWSTRPEAMKRMGYEFLSSFQEAEMQLLDSHDTGAFTDEEVREVLQWLKDNKMFVSDKALEVLNKLSGTSESSDVKSSAIASTDQSEQTTASISDTKTTSSTPEDEVARMTGKKLFSYMVQCPPLVTNTYDKLKYQHPDKNYFQLQDMVYRKLFTKEERDVIQSDLKLYIRVMNRINQLTK